MYLDVMNKLMDIGEQAIKLEIFSLKLQTT